MDKIKLLKQRRETLKKSGEGVRAEIAALVDGESFVELSAFGFSQDFYGEDAQGEGVVTGFATIAGYSFYIVALNFDVSFGGLSKAGCEKIAKTLLQAERSATPVVYLLHSLGVRIGEGIEVMEGVANLLTKAAQMKGSLVQFAVVNGEAYGAVAALAAMCDCVFFTKDAALSVSSPLVLSAKSGKNLKNTEVGGYKALSGALLPAISVSSIVEAREKAIQIYELLTQPSQDAELNESAPALNQSADAEALVSLLENPIEIGGNSCPEVKTVLARIGGIPAAFVVFDNVSINEKNIAKIRWFAELASCYGLPLVNFVDCKGIEQSLSVNNGTVLKEIGEYLNMLDNVDMGKISVVTGKAIGLAYSLFAAKSAGFDYTVALATAQISLFESAAGAEIEYANDKKADKAKLAARYEEEIADPFNAAKGGYLDDIVEPQYLRQYLIAALQAVAR